MNLSSYYLASWISPSGGDDSKLRPIAVKALRKGDTLVVWKLDRLGRSIKDLIEVVTGLGERGVGF